MTSLLTEEQVSALIGVDGKTIRRWIGRGEFPGPVYLPNGRPRWNSFYVEQWVNARPAAKQAEEEASGEEASRKK